LILRKDFLVIVIRLFLGYIFFSSGLSKLTHGQFNQIIGPAFLEDSLAKYGLAFFARIVAISQVICGTLVLSQRFSSIGAIVLLPMNLSILAVTISLNWHGTPYVVGFFLGLNVLLLVYDWKKLIVIISIAQTSTVKATTLDGYSNNVFNLFAILFSIAAMIASRYNIFLTSVFALSTFALIGYSIIQAKALSKLQTIIVFLVILNMALITLANHIIFSKQMLASNTVIIVLLVVLSLLKIRRLEN